MGKKLYIYDRSSGIDRKQAAGRFESFWFYDNPNVTVVGVASLSELESALDRLAKAGKTFDRVLIQTHGSPGAVHFGNEALDASQFTNRFARFHTLFPNRTRLYFDGCNVAEGKEGSAFLEAAGAAWLKLGGGKSFAFTTAGLGLPGFIPWFGGHTIHIGGYKERQFDPGGTLSKPIEIEPYTGREWTGRMQ